MPYKKYGQKLCTYLLSEIDLKYCGKCKQVKEKYEFNKAANRSEGISIECTECHRNYNKVDYVRNSAAYKANAIKRKCNKIQRTPKWADLEKISNIYKNCPPGYHVDHIIPLQGEIVSGLHVENNLQYLPASENLSKSNKYSVMGH